MSFWFRSMLFVPALDQRLIAGAHRRGADAVILDLEDSIPFDAKDAARDALGAAVRQISAQGTPVLVRVNSGALGLRDLPAACAPGVTALFLPKTETPEDVARIEAALPKDGAPRLIPLLETPKGVVNATAIATASQRLAALMFGPEDFAAAMGVDPTPDSLTVPAQMTAIAAKAAELPALGLAGSIAEIADMARFAETLRRTRMLGFDGTPCIHPVQIAPIHAAFTPSASDIAAAESLMVAFEAAGGKAIRHDGRMIDEPVYLRAKKLLARARSLPK